MGKKNKKAGNPKENASTPENEDKKVNEYLESLKAKISSTSETTKVDPPVDEKVNDYLSQLRQKISESRPVTNNSEGTDDYLQKLKEKMMNAKSQQQNQGITPKQVFEQGVRDYLAKNRVKLYVLTPCYGGMCHVNYVNKIMETKEVLSSFGITVVLHFLRNESLVTRGRNNLVAKAMSDQEMTHILFIDSDITWEPIHVLKLIVGDKELSGGIYPIKKYHWDRLTTENIQNILKRKEFPYNRHLTDTQIIYHNLLHYNFNYLKNQAQIQNNMMEIYTLATGFMMIKRSCIEKMMATHPQCKYTDDCGYLQGDENKFAYSLFDCAIVNDHYFSEDWLFCHRWREIGGQIFVDITIDLWHTGQEDYVGRLVSTLDIN